MIQQSGMETRVAHKVFPETVMMQQPGVLGMGRGSTALQPQLAAYVISHNRGRTNRSRKSTSGEIEQN